VIQTYLEEDVVYLYALSLLKGIGLQTLLRIVKVIPLLSELPHLSDEVLQKQLGSSPGKALFQSLHNVSGQWQSLVERAERELHQHLEQGIFPLAITSDLYPPTLKLIPDPPPILFAKGNIELLRTPKAVAIVGTREPTKGGLIVAHHLAFQLAQRNYTIVSGLAKGIDGAAHEGALDAQGKTIAAFGTPLDTIYPAQHRSLAERILAGSGVIVSELALGQRSFRTAFVRRDRIQSGLSLAVFPIQTRNDGGTMHTVNYARTQKRLVVCPKPLSSEANAPQYEGIQTLLNQGKEKTLSFTLQYVNYNKLLSLLQQKLYDLLPDERDGQDESTNSQFLSIEPIQETLHISETAYITQLSSFHQQELPKDTDIEAMPLAFVYTVPPSEQRTSSIGREVKESFLPSPQLTQVPIPFWDQANKESSSTSIDSSPLQVYASSIPGKRGKNQRKQRKDKPPLWEQLEQLHEQESMEDLKKLD
jgi:DNA processing protein